VSKVKSSCAHQKSLIVETLHKRTEFGICHFAGPVIYDASNFVEQNTDRLPDGLLSLAKKSSNPLIAAEFGALWKTYEQEIMSDVQRRSIMRMSVIDKFRSQLRELMAAMKDSQTRYVRCVKPNELMNPDLVDHQSVLRQLRCAGLVTAVELSRETFTDKLTFKVVEERFGCLLNSVQESNTRDMKPDEKSQYMMSTLFAPVIKAFRASDFTMPFAVGRTRVYFRAGALEILETQRNEYFSEHAAVIQRQARKFCKDLKLRNSEKYVIALQAFARGTLVRAPRVRQTRAAIKIQSSIRTFTVQADYKRTMKAAKVVTGTCYGFIEILRRKKEEQAATIISAWYRSRRESTRFQRVRSASISVQALARMMIHRHSFKKQISAVAIMNQFLFACVEASRGMRRENAASRILTWYLSRSQCKKYQRQRSSAVAIQAEARKSIQTKAYQQKLEAARIIIFFCLRLVVQKRDEDRNNAGIKIWSWYKSRRKYYEFRQAVRSIIGLQAIVRGNKQRNYYKKKNQAAQLIADRIVEKVVQRKREHAATRIASWHRSRYQFRQYQRTRNHVVLLQAAVRAHAQNVAYVQIIKERKMAQKRKKKAARLRKKQEKAAKSILLWYRSRKGLRRYNKAKDGIIAFQAMARTKILRDRFLIMKGATLYIEYWFQNAKLSRSSLIEFEQLKTSTIVVQAWARERQQRPRFLRLRNAVLATQTRSRLKYGWPEFKTKSKNDAAVSLAQMVDDFVRDEEALLGLKGQQAPISHTLETQEVDREEIRRLRQEAEQYREQVTALKCEIDQITSDAELHAQEVEAEFEEKILLYEDEVLELKNEIAKCEVEKAEMKEKALELQRKSKNRLQRMQQGIQKTQISHRDYLDKIMTVLDETEASRKIETARIQEELEAVKRDRAVKIASLKDEVGYLRSLCAELKKPTNSRSGVKTARKLCIKMHQLLSPDNLVAVVKEAERRSGMSERHIEEKISSKARKMLAQLEHIISSSDAVDAEKSDVLQQTQEDALALKQQLTRAYEEIGRLHEEMECYSEVDRFDDYDDVVCYAE